MLFLRRFHRDVGPRGNITLKNGNPSLRGKAAPDPLLPGKAEAEESSAAEPRQRNVSGRAEDKNTPRPKSLRPLLFSGDWSGFSSGVPEVTH